MTVRAGAATLALAASLLSACGGGAPLLHPAHTLTEGDVTFAAGTSGRLSFGGLKRADAKLDSDAPHVQDIANGAISRISVAPGVAPFVASRVGLGHHNEAGLTYTGRGFRLDGRHAFEWPTVALSIGASANAAIAHHGNALAAQPQTNDDVRRLSSLSSLRGYGLELPVLFGYRSSADVVKLWAGLRAGFERDYFNAWLATSPEAPYVGAGNATRYWGGGLVGFSIGLSPVEVRVEVDGAYESAHGEISSPEGDLTGDVAGWSLTPAMAISAKF